MIALVAKYYVKPGQVDGVVSALQRMAPMVKEQEPGCTTYKASRSTDDPNLIMLYEEYRDVIKMFDGLFVSESFLLKSNTREMLLRKRA